MPQNLPPDVIRILSFHGPCEVWIGPEGDVARGRASVAPFEDVCFLLLRRGGELESGLLASCAAELQARAEGGQYALRVAGRAHAGIPLGRHPDRGSIEPWMPEGSAVADFVAAPFVPERVELSRDEAGERVRYFGATPAGKSRQARSLVLVRAAFSGIAGTLAVLTFAMAWLWFALQGADYPARPAALALSASGGLALIGGTRLLASGAGFLRWRTGTAQESDAPVLSEALLAPGEARTLGLALLASGLVALTAVALIWDWLAAVIAFIANGAWLLGPAWALHLAHGKPEGRG